MAPPSPASPPARQEPVCQEHFWWNVLLATELAWAALRLLSGELPFHDVRRFGEELKANQFLFDMGHVFLQPATLLWQRWFNDGGDVLWAQKSIHAVFVAFGIGIFHALLTRLRVPMPRRIAATAMLLGSASIMILAPSGHMKMLAFPFINLALYQLVLWERPLAGTPQGWRLPLAAIALGLAAAFLASALAAGPFVCAAVLLIGWKRGGFLAGFWRSAGVGLLCVGVFIACALTAFILFAGQPLTLAGLNAALADKVSAKPAGYDLLLGTARLIFGTGNNLIGAPVLGSVLRAWAQGYITDLQPFRVSLLGQGLPLLLTLALIALVYLRAVIAALRGVACLAALAFLCGAQAWTIYYGLNDPEHWFALTAPTILLLLLAMPATSAWLLPAWAALILAVNLTLIGIPTATYPKARYQTEIDTLYTDKDYIISFTNYPGYAYPGFFAMAPAERFKVDQEMDDRGIPGMFAAMQAGIDAALARGGRVFVFQALDPLNWDAPWIELPRRGITKAAFTKFFTDRYLVQTIPPVAEMQVVQILPKPDQPPK